MGRGRLFKSRRRLFQKEQDELRRTADLFAIMLTDPELTPEDEVTYVTMICKLNDRANEPLKAVDAASAEAADDGPKIKHDPVGYLNYQHETRVLDDFRLYHTLRIPPFIRVNGSVHGGFASFLLMLRRLATPGKVSDFQFQFGHTKERVSEVFNYMIQLVWSMHGHLLSECRMFSRHFKRYAKAIRRSGAKVKRCVGFVDGNDLPIAKPGKFERYCFSGKANYHLLKHQGFIGPNGMFLEFYGPEPGSVTDSCMLGSSGLLGRFSSVVGLPGERGHFFIYGDPAYPLGPWMMKPYGDAQPTRRERVFNVNMARRRIAVEWGFGKMQEEWPFFAIKKGQKIFASKAQTASGVSTRYQVAALLTNLRTCLYGSNASRYFQVRTPSLESYVAGEPDA